MPWPDIGLKTGQVITHRFCQALYALTLAIDERREALGLNAGVWFYQEGSPSGIMHPVATDFAGLRINGTTMRALMTQIRTGIQFLYDGDPDRSWYTDDTFSTLISGITTPPDDAVGTAATWKAHYDNLNDLVYVGPNTDFELIDDSPPFSRRGYFNFQGHENVAFLLGGVINTALPGSDAMLTNEVYRTTDGLLWEMSVAEWDPRYFSSSVSHDGYLWIIAGATGDPDTGIFAMNDVWKSQDGISWSFVSSGGFTERYQAPIASYNGKIYIGAGTSSGVYSSSDGITWSVDGAPPSWATEEASVFNRVFYVSIDIASPALNKIYRKYRAFDLTPYLTDQQP